MTGRVAGAVSSAGDALAAAVPALEAAGCETPRLDAEVLLAAALGVDRTALVADPALPVAPAAGRVFGEAVRRRLAREPVAYIVGRKGFRHIELAVDSRVLIPRPETELLVEVALGLPEGARVHDVGTGSGAVALATAHERPDLHVSASDLSPGAVEMARENARRLGLAVEVQVARNLPGGDYDLVLANLPYVATGELAGLAPEIREHEPLGALLAGADGLDAMRALLGSAPSGTAVALEHAPAQAAAVRALLDGAESVPDLSGRPRVTRGRVP